MADSKLAISKTLVHEGGYVNNPNDPGGATKYGITQKDMPDVDISTITPAQATAYYAEHYWKALYSQIESQDIADKLFDMGVLFGVGTAVRLLQSILYLTVDGVFGPHTLTVVNQTGPIALLKTYKSAFVSHAQGIVNARPQSRVFLTGWVNRINS